MLRIKTDSKDKFPESEGRLPEIRPVFFGRNEAAGKQTGKTGINLTYEKKRIDLRGEIVQYEQRVLMQEKPIPNFICLKNRINFSFYG